MKKLDTLVYVRVPNEDMETIKKIAAEEGLGYGPFVRNLIFKELKNRQLLSTSA